MVEEKDTESLWTYDKKRKARRRRIRIAVIAVVLVLAFFALSYYNGIKNVEYRDYSVVATMTADRTGDVSFTNYKDGIIRYTRDGVVAVGADGSLLWNGSYEMKDPMVAVCSKYVAVADRGGYEIHIFSDKGFVNIVKVLDPIKKIRIAAQGVIAVLVEQDTSNVIYLYESDGDEIAHKMTDINKEGYPIDFDLSYDGKKMITSYLSVKAGIMETYIGFFNFGEVGQNHTDRLVGGIPLTNEFVPKVTFIDNDTACFFMRTGYELYGFKEEISERRVENFENEMVSVLHSDKYFGVILTETGDKKKIIVYNTSGQVVLEKNTSFPYSKAELIGEDIILTGYNSVRIMRLNGTVKYEGSFTTTLGAVYPASDSKSYFFIQDDQINLVRLTNDKQSEE